MRVQLRLARYFEQLAERESDDRRLNLLARAAYVAALPDDDARVQAFERAQAGIGSPTSFTPRCDRGLHLRLLAKSAPSERLLDHIASLEGMPEPWVYGDWAQAGPAPERAGVPQWTVEVEVLTTDYDAPWPPKIEHPDVEPVDHYGLGEAGTDRHLSATLFIWAEGEAQARRLAQLLLADHLASPTVLAHRLTARRTPGEVELKPRGPADLEDRILCVRWQRADIAGRMVTIVWDSSDPFERVDVDEAPDRVTVSVYERWGPLFTPEGTPIATVAMYVFQPRCVVVELAAPLGDRILLDGSTGREPDDLGVWDHGAKELREQVLTVPLNQLDCQARRTANRHA